MSDLNMANRQCCDLDIRDYATKAPWLYADFCNTTTMGFESATAYANVKGQKAIPFYDPIEGTIAMTFQVHPFKVYAMISNGEIETDAVIARKETLIASTAGSLTLTNVPNADSVFVYAEDDFGGELIEGSVTDKVFTAATEGEIVSGSKYIVGYLESKTTGVKRVSFNNKKAPKTFFIQMSTLDKNEDGELVPMRITAYKAAPQRKLDLSFSSSGDPSEITITCDCLVDDKDNVLDVIEITDEAE